MHTEVWRGFAVRYGLPFDGSSAVQWLICVTNLGHFYSVSTGSFDGGCFSKYVLEYGA